VIARMADLPECRVIQTKQLLHANVIAFTKLDKCMADSEQYVAVCDATMTGSNYAAWLKKNELHLHSYPAISEIHSPVSSVK